MWIRYLNWSFISLVVILVIANLSFVLKDGKADSMVATDEQNNIQVFEQTYRSVVHISNRRYQRNLLSMDVFSVPQGTGSGFVWNKDGAIVTNFHVIEGANEIIVRLADQSEWQAEVIGVTPEKDLAVLKIDAPRNLLRPLPLGDSNKLQVGRKVLAIGNPFGLDQTLTVGVVSALGREIQATDRRTIQGVIQTDAAINPGNSGGPLLNSAGALIGVNTAIYSPSGGSAGIGFAIPATTVKKTVQQLLKYGQIITPILGIQIVDDWIAQRNGVRGVIIRTVPRSSNAYKSGLAGLVRSNNGEWKLGDVIVALDNEPVQNSDDLYSLLEKKAVGDTVLVTVVRQQKTRNVKVVLASNLSN